MASALEEWYARQCDGDWEHQYGVKISTLDNPGWSVIIDLSGTEKQDASLAMTRIERTQEDWIFFWIAENRFEIACGQRNLSEALQLFVEWFDSESVSEPRT